MALALYRKYRPRTFAEVIGQEHVTEPLSQALRSGRLHHAYLFSGPRGCGKTSSARILARSLNCEQGPTPEPCGVCASCRSLANDGAGSIDVIEIDAASHGGVDDARDLREKAFFAPASSRYKIYVIDEAHMVSSAGFNALLKLVEEPPEYVKFIFATTEPEKVLGTIRSRTHHYPFRLIPPAVLRPYLQQLTEAEGVHVDPAVLPLVVRAGGGSARDTLSVLDQLISGSGPEGVSYQRAVSLLGVTDVALIDEMCDALAAGDGAAAYQTIDRVAEAGHDPRRFASDLLERLRDLIVLQQVPDAVTKGLIDGPADQLEQMGAQATRLGPATLSRCADIVHNGLVEMRGTTAPRLLLELITARMLLPGADDANNALLQRLERMERRLTLTTDEVRPEPGPAASPALGVDGSSPAAGGGGGISAARAAAAAAARRAPGPAAAGPSAPAAGSAAPVSAVGAGGSAAPVSAVAGTAAPVSAMPGSAAPVSAAPVSAAPVSAASVSSAPVPAAPVSGSSDAELGPPWDTSPAATSALVAEGVSRPGSAGSGSAAPSSGVPHAAAHGAEIAGSAAPVPAAPVPAAPGSAAPGSAAPSSAAPGSTAPGSSALGSAASVSAPPGSAPPGSVATGSAAPGSAAPGSSAPGSTGPVSAAPGFAGSDSAVLGSAGPGAAAPRSALPASAAPGAAASGSAATDFAAPGSGASGSAAPVSPVSAAPASGPSARPRSEPAGIMPDAPEVPGFTPEAEVPGQLTAASIREVWPEIMTAVSRKSKKIAALAQGATVRDLEGQTVVLTFRFPAHAKMVAAEPSLISDALYEALGGRWQIRCDVAGESGPSPGSGGGSAPRGPRSGPSGPAQRSPQTQDSPPRTQDGPPRQGAGPAAPSSGAAPAPQREVAPSAMAGVGSTTAGVGSATAGVGSATAGVGSATAGAGGATAGVGSATAVVESDAGDEWPEPVRPGGLATAVTTRVAEPAVVEDEAWPETARLGGAGAPFADPSVGQTSPAGDDLSGPGGGRGFVADSGPAQAPAEQNGGPAVRPQSPADGSTGNGSSTGGAVVRPAASPPAPEPAATVERPGPRNSAPAAASPPPGNGRAASSGLAAARAAAAGAGKGTNAASAAKTGAWSDGSPTEEAPYDPEYDGPPPPDGGPARAKGAGPARKTGAGQGGFEGFDPGDEPLDDVIDEKTARQSSEQQAVQLLRDALGAEKISES